MHKKDKKELGDAIKQFGIIMQDRSIFGLGFRIGRRDMPKFSQDEINLIRGLCNRGTDPVVYRQEIMGITKEMEKHVLD